MAYRQTHRHDRDDAKAWRLSPLSPWRLIFADRYPWRLSPLSPWRLIFADRYRRPTSWAERRQLRFRALFFVVLGVVLTLAVQAWARKSGWVCPR
jgi:hypothetical protein